ncbi:hypothetical protein AVEN_67184-1 [Araneus ventricosus]|uniref:Uncharacterized protein n=1 Tax=Araneus ventricosus TaxID=182803 RepID=A0A4Y2HDE1_ARAVE|nr:hypothetical protein AVEN_67184-1 [Araneus ventricosus]
MQFRRCQSRLWGLEFEEWNAVQVPSDYEGLEFRGVRKMAVFTGATRSMSLGHFRSGMQFLVPSDYEAWKFEEWNAV